MTISRRLAVGGMAELFLASVGDDPHPVVLKRALPGVDPALIRHEGRVLRAVESPHLVRCLRSADDYLLLEYVAGADLAALLAHARRRGRRLPLEAALAIIDGLARGLSALHESPLRMAHRDVNPANVLLSQEGEVKLADLGVARPFGEAPCHGLALEGTLAYMAPEQLRGDASDARTDLYAAALIAYEVLTGVPARPPGGGGLAELIAARARLPAAPSSVRPDLPAELDAPLMAALAPLPAERPASVEAWRLSLCAAAPSSSPSPVALAAEVTRLGASAAWSARTLAPEAALTPARRRSRLEMVAVAALALSAGALVAWFAATAGSVSATTTASSAREAVSDIAATPALASSLTTAPDPVVAPDPIVAPAPDPIVAPDPDLIVAPAPVVAPAPIPTAAPPGAATRVSAVAPPVRGRRGQIAQGKTRALALRVERDDAGPVYVKGGGAQGFAPQRTAPLGEGTTVVRLHGASGKTALESLVRITQQGDALAFTLAAPRGRWYEASCDGSVPRPTPLRDVPLRASGTRCAMTDAEGNRTAFRLVPGEPE